MTNSEQHGFLLFWAGKLQIQTGDMHTVQIDYNPRIYYYESMKVSFDVK